MKSKKEQSTAPGRGANARKTTLAIFAAVFMITAMAALVISYSAPAAFDDDAGDQAIVGVGILPTPYDPSDAHSYASGLTSLGVDPGATGGSHELYGDILEYDFYTTDPPYLIREITGPAVIVDSDYAIIFDVESGTTLMMISKLSYPDPPEVLFYVIGSGTVEIEIEGYLELGVCTLEDGSALIINGTLYEADGDDVLFTFICDSDGNITSVTVLSGIMYTDVDVAIIGPSGFALEYRWIASDGSALVFSPGWVAYVGPSISVPFGAFVEFKMADVIGYTFAWDAGDVIMGADVGATISGEFTPIDCNVSVSGNADLVTPVGGTVPYDTTGFTLSIAPASNYNAPVIDEVWMDGSMLTQGTDYTLSGLAVTFIGPVNGDIEVVVSADPTPYAITYDLQDGTLYGNPVDNSANPVSFTVEDTFPLTFALPSLPGYTFGGWYAEAACTTPYTQIASFAPAPVAVFAKWTVIDYAITYDLGIGGINNASNPDPTYTIEDTPIVFADPTRADYDFMGWFIDSGFAIPYPCILDGTTGAITLYAKWEATVYTITYDLDDTSTYYATPASGNPASYTVEDTFPLSLSNPTRLGYTFTAWNDGTSNVSNIAACTGDIVLTAVWTPDNYVITYYLDSGTNASGNPASYDVEDLFPNPIVFADPAKYGYEFKGWFAESTFSTQVTWILFGETGAVDLYAKWEATPYTISYLNVGGADMSAFPTSYKVTDASPVALGTPVLAGYTFVKWQTNDTSGLTRSLDETGVIDITTLASGSILADLTYTAVWKAVSVPINIEVTGFDGNPTFLYMVISNTAVVVEDEGFVFGAWTPLTAGTDGKATISVPFGSTVLILSTSEGRYNFAWDDAAVDSPNFVMIAVDGTAPITVTGEYEHIFGYSYAFLIVALAVIGVIIVFVAMSIQGRKP